MPFWPFASNVRSVSPCRVRVVSAVANVASWSARRTPLIGRERGERGRAGVMNWGFESKIEHLDASQ